MNSFSSFNFNERLNNTTPGFALPCSFISKQVPGEQWAEEAMGLSLVLYWS